MITCSIDIEFHYKDIAEIRHFDVINLENYDIILGTPFQYQHKVLISFNPLRVIIGSVTTVQMEGVDVVWISLLAAAIYEEDLLKICEQLCCEVSNLGKSAEETPLSPLHVINHRIPLKDENKLTHGVHPSVLGQLETCGIKKMTLTLKQVDGNSQQDRTQVLCCSSIRSLAQGEKFELELFWIKDRSMRILIKW